MTEATSKLFFVMDPKNKKRVSDYFFDKMAAKKARNEINSQGKSSNCYVTRGPDHWKGLARIVNRTSSQPRQTKKMTRHRG